MRATVIAIALCASGASAAPIHHSTCIDLLDASQDLQRQARILSTQAELDFLDAHEGSDIGETGEETFNDIPDWDSWQTYIDALSAYCESLR